MEKNSQRTPPSHQEAERTLLGAVLRDNAQMEDLSLSLTAEDFYKGIHKRIFQAMLDLYNRGNPIDPVGISEGLDLAELDQHGGQEYLYDLFDATPAGTDTSYYAGIVREKSLRRKLIHVSTVAAASGFDPEREIEDLIGEAEKNLSDLNDNEFSRPYQAIDGLVVEAVNQIEQFYKSKKHVTGLETGFQKLDEKTLGLHPKQMIVIAGRPGMGKTAFGLNLASHIAKQPGQHVLFFSLEMGADQLVQRMIASEARVDSQSIQKGLMTSEDWGRITRAADTLAESNLYFDDSPLLTMPIIFSKARRLNNELKRKGEAGLSLIIVDYLQLMSSPKRVESRHLEIGEISRGMKLMAKDLELPVIALSQLNRSLEARKDKRPMLSDLRESGAIEQDADVILFLYRDIVYREKQARENDEELIMTPEQMRESELIIGKQRSGPTGTVFLNYFAEWTLFADAAYQHEDQQAASEPFI